MLLEWSGFVPVETSPVAEARAAMRQASYFSDQPALLAFTPVARLNPYQGLLYLAAQPNGFAPSPLHRGWRAQSLERVVPRGQGDLILHLHWTSFVLSDALDQRAAVAKVDEFRRLLDSFKGNGGRILWTLHNLLPHDSQFPELENVVQQELADRADALHAMSFASVDLMRSFLGIDTAKVFKVPHPNYDIAYQRYVTRADARLGLGLDPEDIVYVILGALKPYKGLGRVLESFDAVVKADPGTKRRLVVAGFADPHPEVQDFVEKCKAHPQVVIEPKKIQPDRVQYFMAAADIGLAPYQRMLNSGAVLLYQTFGLPVITSETPSVWEEMSDDIAEGCDDTVDGLAAAMLRADRFVQRPVSDLVRRHVERFDARQLSNQFFAEASARLVK